MGMNLSLRRLFVLSMIVVSLGVVSVYGITTLASVKPATSVPVRSVVTIPPLELTLELTKTEFEQGEPINGTLSLKNVGNESITITFGSLGSRFYFDVLDENGTHVYTSELICPAAIEHLPLNPNEQITRTDTWGQIRNIWPTEYYLEQVPKGTYTIIGKSERYSLEYPTDSLNDGLETAPITITIK